MGLRDAKALLITALENSGFGHEPREVQEERNLLAIGEVITEFGRQASAENPGDGLQFESTSR